jgi:RNA polymerase sigma-70 factor, ECF subfamily
MAIVGSAREWLEIERACAALLVQVAEGSEPALTKVYDSTSRMVYGLALRITGDPSAAEDIALDVFLHVWRKAHTYDSRRGTVSSWLITLTRSRAIDWHRSRRRSVSGTECSSESVSDLQDSGPSPEHARLQGERASLIHAALQKLAPERREAVELAYFSGLSHSEIATRTSLPLGTVKTRIRLGMMHLRELLSPQVRRSECGCEIPGA